MVTFHAEHRIRGNIDWLITGWPYEDEVMVLGTTHLNRVQFEADAEFVRETFFSVADRFIPDMVYTLSCEMREYVIARGASYPEALAKLFDAWQPEGKGWQSRLGGQQVAALPAATPELPLGADEEPTD